MGSGFRDFQNQCCCEPLAPKTCKSGVEVKDRIVGTSRPHPLSPEALKSQPHILHPEHEPSLQETNLVSSLSRTTPPPRVLPAEPSSSQLQPRGVMCPGLDAHGSLSIWEFPKIRGTFLGGPFLVIWIPLFGVLH